MRKFALILFVSSLVAVAVGASWSSGANPAEISRGQYLVEGVGMCADCHSPRNERGEFVRARWLQGGPLDFKPAHPMPAWTDVAPPIAGLPGWKDEEVVRLLSTGMSPNGQPLRPPMPSYRMTEEDAKAVVAYLKSLETVTGSASR